MTTTDERNKRHKHAMQRKKKHIDNRIAKATIDKGLLIILTGNGKGKSSSAFGMLARSVGHGLPCGVVQFIKGKWECGEKMLLSANPLVDFYVMNTGFTWETQDRKKDIDAQQIINEYKENLAISLSIVVNILDPDAIVFGGGVSNEITFLDEIKEKVMNNLNVKKLNTVFIKPLYGDSSGVRGAARLGRMINY